MSKSDEVFKRIEARLTTIDPNDRKLVHIFKFILLNDDDSVLTTWILDLKDVKIFKCETGETEAEVTLKMKESLIIDIVAGKIDSTEALNKELIDVEGNLELIFLLKPFISSV